MQARVPIIIAAIVIIILAFIYYRPQGANTSRITHTNAEISDSARQAVVSVWSTLDGETLNQGSGFVVSQDGLILTSLHILAEGDSISVRFDRDVSTDEYKAEVVASDEDYDLLLLKIEADHLQTLPLAPGKARQGDRLWAMGFPSLRGLDAERMTVTSGIVSRINPDENGVPLIIQTDAYLTYGSSGGPLYDLDAGGVVGICTWSQHDENDRPLVGINYALSIEKAIEIFGAYL